MIRKLLLLLVVIFILKNGSAQQASIYGNCFYNNTSERIVVRIAMRNNTNSDATCQIAAIRIGYQFNATVLSYDGFHSFLYNGSNESSGLNDASTLQNNDFQPELNSPIDLGTRNASINGGGSKILTRQYFNRSTTECNELWMVPAQTFRILFDIYFKFQPGHNPATYNLNTPGFGFDSPNFIAQFINSETGNLLDSKKEIAVVFIGTGQNPYQPFDHSGNCSKDNVNPVAINGSNINFISPILGVLSGKIEQAQISRQRQGALLEWTVGNNELIERFDIQRHYENGSFQTIGTLPGDKIPGTRHYSFTDDSATESGTVFYRVKAKSAEGMEESSHILRLQFENRTANKMYLYPNPAVNLLYIDLPQAEGAYSYKIYDVNGKVVVHSQTAMQRPSVNVSKLATGLYYLEATHLPTGKRYITGFSRQ